MGQSLYGKFYSPYINNGKVSMDDCYQSYKQEPQRRIELDGHVYSKIISCSRFYGYEDYSFHIVWEPPAQIRRNDTLIDEYGNIFTVRSFEMIHFFGNVPEWYLNTIPMVITGNTSEIGNYLAPKKEVI